MKIIPPSVLKDLSFALLRLRFIFLRVLLHQAARGLAFCFALFVASSLPLLPAADYDQKPSKIRQASPYANYTSKNFHSRMGNNSYNLHENTDVRLRLQKLFYAPVIQVLEAPQTIYSQRNNNFPVMFQVRLNNTQPDKLYYAFINRSFDSDGKIIYPVSSRGSYLIRRNLEKNRIDQIKIFLSENIGNEQSFIRLSRRPNSPYSEVEVVIFGRMLYLRVPLSIPFDRILTMPLHEFISGSARSIRWDLLLSDPISKEWQLVKKIPDRIRPLLYQISEVYDGAMDARGLFVRIETGEELKTFGMNCSGFVKWVADGVYRSNKDLSEQGLYLDIAKLKQRQILVRGLENPWSSGKETSRDPYFGLDWIRAIAQQLMESEEAYSVDVRTADVQGIPFFNYIENVGYPVENINTMMYLLAIQNPGSFYLGAINGAFGDPPLHQYYHEVVFFPYFKENGEFQLVVMDTGVERSAGFIERSYKGNYIHFSQVQAPNRYRLAPLGIS